MVLPLLNCTWREQDLYEEPTKIGCLRGGVAGDRTSWCCGVAAGVEIEGHGDRYPFSEEIADLERQGRAWERQQRQQAEERAERAETEKNTLLEKLERMRAASIDPDAF